jgi:hypothetical protein
MRQYRAVVRQIHGKSGSYSDYNLDVMADTAEDARVFAEVEAMNIAPLDWTAKIIRLEPYSAMRGCYLQIKEMFEDHQA